ncbi:cellulose-binding GDSL lipase acylhydrolase [Aspergillus sclerotialis]|uniref:Cellulose-binding GDSL lipase acylhydrolase n=1 Tax=Aspergillus sclerotialis TaxID=2070753 RepID=A0A3A3A0L8_9EURO|nr:cellulose-binding GDSL lipase acylhydrolase [Aspergillus sclerotialis]
MKVPVTILRAGIITTVAGAPLVEQSANPTYFFTFGNSYTMTSFSASGEQPSPSNPMGNPSLGTGTTTGGINWVGYLTTQQNTSLVQSYNLAIGGASIDNEIIKTQSPDMVSQVNTFQNVYSQKPESAPWTGENAVFGFWIGINDAGWGYSSTDANQIVPKLMDRYESLIENIYNDGGRKFLLINVPPTSRSPNFISQGEDAMAKHAAWVDVFNKELASMIEGFKGKHSDVTTVLYDSYAFMSKVLNSPTEYEFPDATCIDDDGERCVWWNDYHPGKKYHRFQAEDMKGVLGSLGPW